ncbi:hypothetical protein F2Q69_00061562 [Brassica cretica]|uniref:Uncharacterized protein n=1 Tax=Brassica cretica TaxID=69181 RepID=A0A8S9RFS9_BRACR|nr:hypothetical protein F2Q69_00061562 [Brassica cretica]
MPVEMAKLVLDRGPDPLGFGAGRVWTRDFMTRKKTGFAGQSSSGTVFAGGRPTTSAGKPKSPASRRLVCFLHRIT